MKKTPSKLEALRVAIRDVMDDSKMTKRDHEEMRKEIARLADILASRASKGDAEAVISLGLIGVEYAALFQRLAISDEGIGTKHTRPYFEISAYAPAQISGEVRNRNQVDTLIGLGRKWSKHPWQTWHRERKNVDFTKGLAALAHEVYSLAVKSGKQFNNGREAFEYGFGKMVEGVRGRDNFLRLYGPACEIAQSVKRRKSTKAGEPPPVSVQFAEVKSKCKRTFNSLWRD